MDKIVNLMRRDKKKVFVVMLLIMISITGLVEASTAWSPWEYDKNNDGTISIEEAVHAVNHYRWGELLREQTVEVMKIYFRV